MGKVRLGGTREESKNISNFDSGVEGSCIGVTRNRLSGDV